MKKMMIIALLFGNVAFASGNGGTKILDTDEAITAALDEFEASYSHDVADAFEGVKAWPVSGGVKVKIYVDGRDAVSYSCHRHDVGSPFECH